jgi:integrase
MVVCVRQGKRSKDRYTVLSKQLLGILRDYWQRTRPSHWLLPGRNPSRPLTKSAIAPIRRRQKNATPNHGKHKGTATPSLIRWSIQEVRRIAIRLARRQIQPAHIIAWSLWRRAHQAVAQRAHFKAKQQL